MPIYKIEDTLQKIGGCSGATQKHSKCTNFEFKPFLWVLAKKRGFIGDYVVYTRLLRSPDLQRSPLGKNRTYKLTNQRTLKITHKICKKFYTRLDYFEWP